MVCYIVRRLFTRYCMRSIRYAYWSATLFNGTSSICFRPHCTREEGGGSPGHLFSLPTLYQKPSCAVTTLFQVDVNTTGNLPTWMMLMIHTVACSSFFFLGVVFGIPNRLFSRSERGPCVFFIGLSVHYFRMFGLYWVRYRGPHVGSPRSSRVHRSTVWWHTL